MHARSARSPSWYGASSRRIYYLLYFSTHRCKAASKAISKSLSTSLRRAEDIWLSPELLKSSVLTRHFTLSSSLCLMITTLAPSPTWGSRRSVDTSSQITGGLSLRSALAQIYCHCSAPSSCCTNGFYVFFIRVFRRRFLLFIQSIWGLKTNKNMLRENLNFIIKIAAQLREEGNSTHLEFLSAQISALQWAVWCQRHSPEHHIHAPPYPEMIPGGSCQLQVTGGKKPRNLLLLISSKSYIHTRLTCEASNPKPSKPFR